MKLIHRVTRRRFLKQALAAGAAFTIVPRHVFGAAGQPPPSETLGGALIGVGGRGPGTYGELTKSLQEVGLNVAQLAQCDVRWLDRADNKTMYTDFRRVLERKDIDVVAIATPPHWHALISIAAMEAGKEAARWPRLRDVIGVFFRSARSGGSARARTRTTFARAKS